MKLPLQSIRWRLQLWHGLLLLVAIVAFCVVGYRLAWNNQMRRVSWSVFQLERHLFGPLMHRTPAEGEDPVQIPMPELLEMLRSGNVELPEGTISLFQVTEPGYAYFSLFDNEGGELLQSENYPEGIELPEIPEGEFYEDMRSVGNRREMVRGNPRGFRSVVGRDISSELADMRRLTFSLVLSGLAVWFLGVLGGWWFVGRALRPIKTISSTAARIADGNLSERIDTAGNSELDQLAAVLNQTFERLHVAFERRRRFTADASHELRTPVTILIAETDRILKRERSKEEYREALVTCRESAGRMRKLVDSLLLLTRQEDAQFVREPADLAALSRDVVQSLQALAAGRRVTLHTELAEAPCEVDPDAIAIVISNLVANAIHHNREGGNVWVRTGVEAATVFAEVRDDGPGIAPEDQPHVFERFYRADKARTGSSGHTGLGLAIARTIVDSHGARLDLESEPGAGAVFRLSLAKAAV